MGDNDGGFEWNAAMPFYRDHIYPQIVRVLGDPPPVREIRQRIVRGAEGKVLEIGVGPGVNFVHYDPAKVSKIYALEPNRHMVRLAERQRRGRTSTSNSWTFRGSESHWKTRRSIPS